jgi:hexosaminidase
MNGRLAELVPYPVSVMPGEGNFPLSSSTQVRPADAQSEAAATAAGNVIRGLPAQREADQPSSQRQTGQIVVAVSQRRSAEEYRLAISPDRIEIEAGGLAGAFYAAQTLRQLLPADAWRAAAIPGTDWSVPCARIEDAPKLAWRGAHLDVARHFLPKRDLIALVDGLAALKFNRLHLHLTDDQGWRIESKLHPAVHEVGSHRPRTRISLNEEQPKVYDDIPHGGYYTLADLAEINAYAAERMITVVPEIEMPGHASALLAAMPELAAGNAPAGGFTVSADWGILPYLMSPLPVTQRFIRDILGELLTAIPASYVHIGGDECVLDSWRDDPRVDAYRRERGLATPADLHAAFLRDIADMLSDDFGARTLVWDEGFASTGAAVANGDPATGRAVSLRPDTIVMAWRGLDIARKAALAGHDVITVPVLPTYFDYSQADTPLEPVAIGGPITVQDVADFAPVPANWPAEAGARVLGTQFQVWTEYIPNRLALEYMVFPRACALADVAWSGRPSQWSAELGSAGNGATATPPLEGRVAAHLRKLDAAGVAFRPLTGPRPWQQGGDGPRRHRQGYPISDVAEYLDNLAAADPS